MSIEFHEVKKVWKSKRSTVLILTASVLVAGLYRFSLDYALVLSAFLFFVIVPGICISVWVFEENEDFLDLMATAFGCGMAFNALFFLFRGLVEFPFDFDFTAKVLAAAICLFALVTVFYGKTRRRAGHWFQMGDVALGPLICVVLLCIVLLFNENVLLLTSDSLAYLPRIIHWQQEGTFGVDTATDFVTFLGRTRLYRTAIQPFLLHITKADPVVQYEILTSLLGFFFACSFYFFLKRIWDNKAFLTIGILLFVCHFGGLWFNFVHSNYSWFVAWSLYFVCISIMIERLSNRNAVNFSVPIVMACTIAIYHAAFALMTVFSFLSFVVGIFVFSDKSRKWLRYTVFVALFVVFVATILAYAIDVLWIRLPILDRLGLHRTQSYYRGFMSAFGSGFIINPISGPALFSGLWGLLSVAFLPGVFRNRLRLKRNATAFLFSNTIFPLAVLFNPVLVSLLIPPLRHAGVERLIFAMPYIAIIALGVTFFVHKWQANPKDVKIRLKTVGVLSLVLATGLPVFLYRILLLMPSDWGYRAQPFLQRITGLPTGPFRYNHPALLQAMGYIKNKIRPDALFVTDPITAELLPVMVENPVLEAWRADPLRIWILTSTSMKALGPDLDAEGTAALLRRRDIEFVLINNSWNEYTKNRYFGALLDRDSVLFDVRKFKEHPERFTLVFEDHDVLMFRVCSEGLPN